MNYLAHLLIVKPLDDESVSMGATLPDLLTAFDRRANLHSGRRRLRVERELQGGHDGKLLEGMAYHWNTDNLFHSSDYFRERQEALMRVALEHDINELDARRNTLTHLLIELCIDAHIHSCEPAIADEYHRALLAFARSDEMRSLAETCNFPARSFRKFCDRFVAGRYLVSYGTHEGLCDCIDRIARRFGIPGLDADACKALEPVVRHAREVVADYGLVIDEIRAELGLRT